MQIRVDLDFSRRGDLSLQLKAPSSTTSPLTRSRTTDNTLGSRNLTDWVITTLFHWGEDPTGKWELVIEDFDKRIPSSGYYLLRKLLIIITIVIIVVIRGGFEKHFKIKTSEISLNEQRFAVFVSHDSITENGHADVDMARRPTYVD